MDSNYELPIHLEIAAYENKQWIIIDRPEITTPRLAVVESRDIRPYWQEYGLALLDQEPDRCDLGGLVQRAVSDIDPYYYRDQYRDLLDRVSEYAESLSTSKRVAMRMYYDAHGSSSLPYLDVNRRRRDAVEEWSYQPHRFKWFKCGKPEINPYMLSSWAQDWWDCHNPGRWGADPILQKIRIAISLDGSTVKPRC